MKTLRKSSRNCESFTHAGPGAMVFAGLEPLGEHADEHGHDVSGVDVIAQQVLFLGLAHALGAQANQFGVEMAATGIAFQVSPGEQADDAGVVAQKLEVVLDPVDTAARGRGCRPGRVLFSGAGSTGRRPFP